MWFLIWMPMVIAPEYKVEKAAVWDFDRESCVMTADKMTKTLAFLKWRGAFRCKHATWSGFR